MSVEITRAFVEQYSANIMMLVQQRGSILRGTVEEESVTGKTAYFEQVGKAEVQDAVSRHDKTPIMDTPHARRQVSLITSRWADLIDNADKVRMLIDPTSKYALAGAWAHGRRTDKHIIDAATGDSLVNGGAGTTPTTQSLPTAQKVAVDFQEVGPDLNVGLTVGKLRQMSNIFGVNSVPDDEERFLAVSQKQITDLLQDDEVTSGDYNLVRALVEGKVDKFMGFTFKRTQLLTLNSSTDVRTCFAYITRGLGLGIGSNPKNRISERAGLNYSVQVFSEMDQGATRIEEELVVECLCDESPP